MYWKKPTYIFITKAWQVSPTALEVGNVVDATSTPPRSPLGLAYLQTLHTSPPSPTPSPPVTDSVNDY